MAALFTVTLTDLELHMAVLAVNNMKDDEEHPTRRRALLRLHRKLQATATYQVPTRKEVR